MIVSLNVLTRCIYLMVFYVPMVMYGKLYENIPHMLGNRWLALILNSVEVGSYKTHKI